MVTPPGDGVDDTGGVETTQGRDTGVQDVHSPGVSNHHPSRHPCTSRQE